MVERMDPPLGVRSTTPSPSPSPMPMPMPMPNPNPNPMPMPNPNSLYGAITGVALPPCVAAGAALPAFVGFGAE
jgi:hypothetical protein